MTIPESDDGSVIVIGVEGVETRLVSLCCFLLCFGVFVIVFLWWCGCVSVVVLLCFCGGVFALVFL